MEDYIRNIHDMNRVVITGMGIYSCIGKNQEEVKESLYNGVSGIGIDPARKEMGYFSALTGMLERPDLEEKTRPEETPLTARTGRICLHGNPRGVCTGRHRRGLPR